LAFWCPRKINPLKPIGIRGMDVDPVLTTETEIDEYEQELKKRMKTIKNGLSPN